MFSSTWCKCSKRQTKRLFLFSDASLRHTVLKSQSCFFSVWQGDYFKYFLAWVINLPQNNSLSKWNASTGLVPPIYYLTWYVVCGPGFWPSLGDFNGGVSIFRTCKKDTVQKIPKFNSNNNRKLFSFNCKTTPNKWGSGEMKKKWHREGVCDRDKQRDEWTNGWVREIWV